MLIENDFEWFSFEFSHELTTTRLTFRLIKNIINLMIDFSHVVVSSTQMKLANKMIRLPYLVSWAKLNFRASLKLGTVREFLRILFNSPMLRAISLRNIPRFKGTSFLFPSTGVTVNRSMSFKFFYLLFFVP